MEEAVQLGKLEAILGVDRDMEELRAMYQEFRTLVNEQQKSLDCVDTNIDKAQAHIDKGVTELKSANGRR